MNKNLFRKRLFAMAIDCIIFISVIFFILSVVLLSSNGIVVSWLTKYNLKGLTIFIPFMLMILLKDVFGRSLGKRFMRLTIVDLESKHNIRYDGRLFQGQYRPLS